MRDRIKMKKCLLSSLYPKSYYRWLLFFQTIIFILFLSPSSLLFIVFIILIFVCQIASLRYIWFLNLALRISSLHRVFNSFDFRPTFFSCRNFYFPLFFFFFLFFLRLTSFHIFGFIIMLFSSFPAFLKQYIFKKSNLDFNLSGSYWPAVLTIKRIEKNVSLLKKVIRWIEELQEAKEVRRIFLLSGDGTADIVAFEACINSLRKCWYVRITALHCTYIFTLRYTSLVFSFRSNCLNLYLHKYMHRYL